MRGTPLRRSISRAISSASSLPRSTQRWRPQCHFPFLRLWRMAQPNFGGRFLNFMGGVVAGSAVEPPVDLSLEAWKLAFASEASWTS